MTLTPSAYHPSLNANEQELVDCVAAGRSYQSPSRPGIRAALVRDLLVGDAAPSGVSIKGATIEGVLSIRDARGTSGGACNALILDDCHFDGGGPDEPAIDARNSRLTRLAMTDCRAQGIDLSSAVVLGDIDLVSLKPRVALPTADGLAGDACWIVAHGLRVEGSFTVAHSTLTLPWRAGDSWPPEVRKYWPDVRQPFALDLSGAKIAGSLHLRPGFASTGGVNIAGATIGGEFWADGAGLHSSGLKGKGVDAEALFGQRVDIHGSVLLQYDAHAGRRFEAEGAVDLSWAHIGGSLGLRGAKLTQSDGEREAPPFSLWSTTVSGELILGPEAGTTNGEEIPFEVDEPLWMTNAVIGGMAWIACPHGLVAIDASFGNSLHLLAGRTVIISGSQVASNLEIRTPEKVGPTAEGREQLADLVASSRQDDRLRRARCGDR